MQENSSGNPKQQTDIQEADSAYRPIASFSSWSQLNLDLVRWERYARLIEQRKNVNQETLKRARDIVKRTAAVETGAIEGLYQVDRGFTFTVATETAMWQAAVQAKGTTATSLIESQLYAYDFVLDFATQKVPIAEAWVRQLHLEICRGQHEYIVHTAIGTQNHKLPLGEYKQHPNHVRTPDGTVHSYAPVDMTSIEMGKFCAELLSELFTSAHPILQASYSHYCLTAIHPFADGNGRVARALASVFTYRSQSVPLLILAEHRKEYFEVLSKADQGDYQSFVDFVLERTLDAMQLVDESLRAAKTPPMTDSLATLRKLYVTKGGYTHAEVDRAANILLNLLSEEFQRLGQEHNVPNQFQISVGQARNTGNQPLNDSYRFPLSNVSTQLIVRFAAFEPALAQINRSLFLQVPIDCGVHDDIIFSDPQTSEVFRVRLNELLPAPTPSTRMRIKMWAESIVGEAVASLSKLAEEDLKRRGYRK